VYKFTGGTVRRAVDEFKAGTLELASGRGEQLRPAPTGRPRDAQERSAEIGRPREGTVRLRIAVSSEGDRGLESTVSHHFGRCPYYVLVDVEGEELRDVATVENPFFGNHQPGQVPRFITEQGADVIVTGGMGRRALGFFENERIETVTGARGTVAEVLEDYLGGRLTGAEPCRDSVRHTHEHRHRHHSGREHEHRTVGETGEESEIQRVRRKVEELERLLSERRGGSASDL
jgi:predicted Fe-Mo cluster-binding NifX family protein